MSTSRIRRFLVTLPFVSLALLAGAGCRHGAVEGTPVGDMTASVSIDPDPPGTGDNTLWITLRDASGSPVPGAKLDFEYDMPAMGPSMPEMKGGGKITDAGDGRYRVDYSLPMLGDWRVSVGISAPGHAPAELRMKVSPPHRGFTLETEETGTPESGGTPAMTAGTAGRPTTASGKLLNLGRTREQLIGVTFAPVERRPLTASLRAPGIVDVDERQLSDVTLKYEAYVERLLVGETGKSVKKGQPLVEIYSPDLLSAEQELVQARRAKQSDTPGGNELLRAARERLSQWDLTPAQIDAVEREGRADGRVIVHAPASGVVLDKPAVVGMHAMPGMMLYRIGNLGNVWVQADLYEFDAPFVALGQTASAFIPALGGGTDAALVGKVTFVAPTLDEKTRTLRARLEFPNATLRLKPGMYADVRIEAPLGERLVVPERALLLSGEHRYAFVDRGNGRLQAVEVRTGVQSGEWMEVEAGLSTGERVAVDATFLLGSEATLRDALPKWSGE